MEAQDNDKRVRAILQDIVNGSSPLPAFVLQGLAKEMLGVQDGLLEQKERIALEMADLVEQKKRCNVVIDAIGDVSLKGLLDKFDNMAEVLGSVSTETENTQGRHDALLERLKALSTVATNNLQDLSTFITATRDTLVEAVESLRTTEVVEGAVERILNKMAEIGQLSSDKNKEIEEMKGKAENLSADLHESRDRGDTLQGEARLLAGRIEALERLLQESGARETELEKQIVARNERVMGLKEVIMRLKEDKGASEVEPRDHSTREKHLEQQISKLTQGLKDQHALEISAADALTRIERADDQVERMVTPIKTQTERDSARVEYAESRLREAEDQAKRDVSRRQLAEKCLQELRGQLKE
ncbi:hypothetical protein S7711_00207 [Stachybotrys chartarum IBT 7711]|uniref:Uncharacterized protein n=1 Tax=Stachybotrys chartarum (strain CBS 109288 / IBT 7711) TaxID=1280523 RepID=A0A084B3S6_STACB|nr:hypothetical protein S7711_00207 [Stachybotrys chartarum IBT 7711]